MRQLLSIDKRVALYGSKKHIEETEMVLLKNIPELPTLSQSQARLRIQDCLENENENVKVDITIEGHGVWIRSKSFGI